MTELEFDRKFDEGELDEQYAEYIMENCHGDRLICNGDTLIEAMEDFYLLEAFKEDVIDERIQVNV